jgi:hypothetical protein
MRWGRPIQWLFSRKRLMPADFTEKMTCGSYLARDQVLGAQHPLSGPVHHDEMLFVHSARDGYDDLLANSPMLSCTCGAE